MIKLRDLEYLDAIEIHRHFGKAAEACHVSQPTLSGQIMKLEEQLGVSLIERHTRNIMLTPAGEQLLEKARKVLIAGDFNNWSSASTPMQPMSRPGEWGMSLPLGPGRYRYRFIVDGLWVTDPHNQYVETNQFGELNNVVEVD